MAVLLIGLILFLGAHSVKIVAPQWRARAMVRIGEGPYKGLYTLLTLSGLVLIVWGFAKAWENPLVLYLAPAELRPVAEALMLPALILVVASGLPTGYLKRAVRHPLLFGTMLWAVAHLLVNGDLAGVVLFGAFFAWAIFDLVAQPRRAVATTAPVASSDLIAVAAGSVFYGLLALRLHFWLFGVEPFA